MTKVFIVAGSPQYRLLMERAGFHVIDSVDKADLVLFTGGADVSPTLYHAKKHPATFNDTYRDDREKMIFATALEKGIPMVGICRGGQFLNVMSGGEMYQDVTRHVGDHIITDAMTGETLYVSSTHHQMMKPSKDAIIIATACLGGEREWYEGQIFKRDVSKEDIEVVYYKHTNALCFQPHPEFVGSEFKNMREYFYQCLERCLGIEKQVEEGVGVA